MIDAQSSQTVAALEHRPPSKLTENGKKLEPASCGLHKHRYDCLPSFDFMRAKDTYAPVAELKKTLMGTVPCYYYFGVRLKEKE